MPVRGNNSPIKTITNDDPTRNYPIKNNDNGPVKEPVRNPIKNNMPDKQNSDFSPRFEAPVRQNNYETPKAPNRSNESSPSNNGGHRPR